MPTLSVSRFYVFILCWACVLGGLSCMSKKPSEVIPPTLTEQKIPLQDMFRQEPRFKRKASLEQVIKASAFIERKSFVKAQELLTRGMSLDPSNPVVYHYFGLNLYEQGRWEEGVKEFRRAADLFKNEENMGWNAESLYKVKEGLLKLGSN